ncbi:MAG: hypothetical protein ACTHLA_04265 [Asticcacaulis sp.]|uniref:hypothetical protein n=1 Tax=Asticcacaulis sp. TaxID=1872648 RepID=UPI003F7B787F
MSDRADRIKANEDALKARLAKLREFSEGVAERLRQLDMPKTYLEAARGARAVQQADRLLLLVPKVDLVINGPLPETTESHPSTASRSPSPSLRDREESDDAPLSSPPCGEAAQEAVEGYNIPDPKTGYQAVHPARLDLRDYADRLMEAVGEIAEADTYLEALRAARYGQAAERMLRQLYHLPDGGYGPWTYDHDDDEDEDWDEDDWDEDEDDDDGQEDAEAEPVLYNWQKYVWGTPSFRHPDNELCIEMPGEEDKSDWQLFCATCDELLYVRLARESGVWRDGTPYDPDDPWHSCPRLQYFYAAHPPPE